jgi:hypothetical protein
MNSRVSGSTAILKLFILSAISLTSCHLLAQDQEPIGQHYDIPIVLDPNEIGMSQPEVLDINGDERKDVVFSSMDLVDVNGEAPLEIWTSNESSGMERSTEFLVKGGIPADFRGYRQILPADFNGDGHLDLFLESHGPEWDCGNGTAECWPGGLNSLLLSDNDGKLNNVTTTNLPAFSDFSHGSTVLDFDSDGDLDIFVANSGGSPLYNPDFSYLLENDGAGSFSVAADCAFPNQSPLVGRNGIFPEGDWAPAGSWAVPIDANGDGHTDLSFSFTALPWDEWKLRGLLGLNSGNGTFEYVPGDAFPAPSWADIPRVAHSLVYDLNYDGLDDMLLYVSDGDFGAPFMQVLISNGDGTFRDETTTRNPNQNFDVMSDYQLHDLDGDGHPDLFSDTNFGQVDVRINDGEGYFRLLSTDWVEMSESWVVLDVDNDGGTDFFESSYLGLRLHKMNLPYGAEMDGTSDDDRLIGGAHDNVFSGFEGDDVLDGGLGDDDLDGGAGNDELIGGKGDDSLIPGSGNDRVDGGPDRDTVEYDFPLDQADISYGQTSQISSNQNNSNDQVQATEYALFSDAATPLPTDAPSSIQSLNGLAGLWYDPDLDGEGFNVITTSSGIVIFYYGFDAEGQRLWLISESLGNDLDFQEVFDLQMYEADGGTFSQPAPSSEALSEWGRLKGVFDACGDGRFALHGKDGVKISYQTRLAGITNADCEAQALDVPSGLAGLWYDPLLDGEGYNIIITETATIILFYGYAADGQRLWLISQALSGAPQIGQTVTVTMYVSTDGTFDEPLASSEVLEEWGTLELTVSSCATAIANLNGDDGEKTSNLDKLAGIDQSTCP